MNIPLQMKWIGGYIMKKFDFKDLMSLLYTNFVVEEYLNNENASIN